MNNKVKDIIDNILKNIFNHLATRNSFTLYYNEVFQELEISLAQDIPNPNISYPAINSIYLTEHWQNKGVLNYLVDRLLELEWVNGVVIQSITNPTLGMSLLHNPKWIPIINTNQFHRLDRIIPLVRDNKEYYDFFLQTFENKRPVFSTLDLSILKENYIRVTSRKETDIPYLTDDQLCGFAPEHDGTSIIKLPECHYNNYKSQITALAENHGISAHHYIGMSKFFDNFITLKNSRS
ncbi:hypothetical protein ACSTK7_19535 [Vibrio parahaemolyticus]|uniref:hypothetical protein n=1 Tax=Vibrio parahaemolyticus TaxID=670 RepID=UPI001E3A63FF|nr:hypothetical protein [Vibrio parahaemolyticus]